jgi:hypothetical protein
MPLTAPVLTPPLSEGDRLTRDEFLRRWEAMPNLKWAELINGVVHMPSPVSEIHGDFHGRLSFWLGTYLAATGLRRSHGDDISDVQRQRPAA